MSKKKKSKSKLPKYGKFPHFNLRKYPIKFITTSPENKRIYRKISPEDPDIIELAKSIKDEGILEDLIISEDDYIISGHRRFAAAHLVGLDVVPVKIMHIHHEDPQFILLLRHFNRQRVKGIDEILHEDLIDVSPEELVSYRSKSLEDRIGKQNELGQMEIITEGRNKRYGISQAKYQFVAAIKKVIAERRKFWPLSVRLVHYALLNDPPVMNTILKPTLKYSNNPACYGKLSNLLTRLRLNGDVVWESIADTTRPATTWLSWTNPSEFIREQVKEFLNGYSRDYLQSQPAYIEVCAEKLTLKPIIHPVCAAYGIPYMIGRGFSSIDSMHELSERCYASGKNEIILLVLSDHDPDGDEIADGFVNSLNYDFGHNFGFNVLDCGFSISNIQAMKVALTPEQAKLYNLPKALKAKKKSTRYKGFVEKYGSDDAWELEALAPNVLQDILRNSIENALDRDLYSLEEKRAEEDEEQILKMKAKTTKILSGWFSEEDEDE